MDEQDREEAGMNILLVEDDDDHAMIIGRWLAKVDLKSNVQRVSDGIEALAFVKKAPPYHLSFRPDLVLLDLKLPRLSGHEVLQSIKSNPDLLDIPVVVLTTSEDRRDIEKAYKSHANSYLVKPSDSEEFCKMMNLLLRYWGKYNRTRPQLD
jgi:CheY-like chemotaxis protein